MAAAGQDFSTWQINCNWANRLCCCITAHPHDSESETGIHKKTVARYHAFTAQLQKLNMGDRQLSRPNKWGDKYQQLHAKQHKCYISIPATQSKNVWINCSQVVNIPKKKKGGGGDKCLRAWSRKKIEVDFPKMKRRSWARHANVLLISFGLVALITTH